LRGLGLLLPIFALAALTCGFPAAAATYYVDCVGGHDGNMGTSPSAAWRTLANVNSTTFVPGDQILFKAGCAWSGRLWPKGSGSFGSPIGIDMFGAGAKPVINGDGAAQEALLLYNQEYWEIKNLEITNYDPAGPEVNPLRQGVRVLGQDVGTLHHIHLVNLEVHDVNGSLTVGRDQGKCNAGILFDVEAGSTPTHFDDLLIEGCYVHDCERSGIKLWGASRWAGAVAWLHENVIIRNNVVDYIAGDGLSVHVTSGALVEHNTVSRSCYWTVKANAALWTWSSDDAVIQYNEVYQTSQTWDGMAFDIDGYCQRNIYQYNYSHDNDGGFVMIIGVPDCVGGQPEDNFCRDNHFRYNISQNDRERIYRLVGKIENNYIYNNTVYLDDTNPHWVHSGACGSPTQWPQDTYFWNNIFYNTTSSGADFFLGSCQNTVFDYNVFYGNHPASEPADPHKLTSDPQLVDPGTAAVGRDACAGYRLRPTSPCLDSGMAIPDNGGLDYWDNPVPSGLAPDRGAHEYRQFPDVLLGHWAFVEIGFCVLSDVVQGYPDGLYRPGSEVTRDQMAVFISRALAGGDGNVPDGPLSATFDDVPTDHWAYKHVEYCVAEAVVQGYDPVTYSPTAIVSRDQMAVYMSRAVVGGDGNVPDGPPEATFNDVPTDHWAYKYVEYCASEEIVQGYDPVTYAPLDPVTRDQMAVFIYRAFDLWL